MFLLPIVDALQGEAFCSSEELALDDEALQMCMRNIHHFMPQALPAIAHALHENARHACRDWFHGICHAEPHPPLLMF